MLKKKIYVLVFLLLISIIYSSNNIVIAQTGIPELDDAQINFASALKAIQNADSKIIDLHPYVNILNSALGRLQEAETLAKSGNVTQAVIIAKTVTITSIQIEANIASYSSLTTKRTQSDLESSLIYSVIALVIAESVIVIGWITFKRRYLQRVMESKPEVIVDES